ncbi:glycosyltransferase family 2 protein [Marinomonas sp.]
MVYIVVLNWNGWQDTLACLESLYQLNTENFKVVVCDNGSRDNSVDEIKQWHKVNGQASKSIEDIFELSPKLIHQPLKAQKKDLIVIKSGQNLGYAGGNNLALTFSLAQDDMEHVWILNNDTEVDPEALNQLEMLSNKNAGLSIVGSTLVYFSQRSTLQGIGGRYNYWLGSSSHVLGHSPVGTDATGQLVDYPIGASMFIPRSCLGSVGLLSEDYFLYYEELDYVNRACEQGYFVDIATNSIVYHKEGASIAKSVLSDFYFIRNKFIIAYKFKPVSLPVLLLMLPLWGANRLRRREYKKAINCFNAFGSFLTWVFVKKANKKL